MTDKRLQRALRFRHKDLKVNQAGQLSPRQVRRIRRQRSNYSIAAYLLGGIFLLVALLLWQRTQIGAIFFGIVGAMAIYGEFRLSRVRIENLEVEHLTGTIKKVQTIDEADELEYVIQLGDVDFETNYREFRGFTDEQRYTVHFVRFAVEDGLPVDTPPMILSAELLSSAPASQKTTTQPRTA